MAATVEHPDTAVELTRLARRVWLGQAGQGAADKAHKLLAQLAAEQRGTCELPLAARRMLLGLRLGSEGWRAWCDHRCAGSCCEHQGDARQ